MVFSRGGYFVYIGKARLFFSGWGSLPKQALAILPRPTKEVLHQILFRHGASIFFFSGVYISSVICSMEKPAHMMISNHYAVRRAPVQSQGRFGSTNQPIPELAALKAAVEKGNNAKFGELVRSLLAVIRKTGINGIQSQGNLPGGMKAEMRLAKLPPGEYVQSYGEVEVIVYDNDGLGYKLHRIGPDLDIKYVIESPGTPPDVIDRGGMKLNANDDLMEQEAIAWNLIPVLLYLGQNITNRSEVFISRQPGDSYRKP